MARQVGILRHAAEAIGGTPLVGVRGLLGASAAHRVLLKWESLNPGGSKKDRAALAILQSAKERGALQPGQSVVELTSGNFGTGMAIACACEGHPFIAVMSEGNSQERARMMKSLGAEVVLVPQAEGGVAGQVSGADLDRVREVTEQISAETDAFRADQFQDPGGFRAHYDTTAPEIWEQTDNGKHLHAFVDFLGSGGTFGGCASYFKEKSDGRVKCYLVEPVGSQVLHHGPASVTQPSHRIQGGGYSIPRRELPYLSKEVTGHALEDICDGYFAVTDELAMLAARTLAAEHGIFAGFSSGANAWAATQVIAQWGNADGSGPDMDGSQEGGGVACLVCDSGLKYLSTDLWP